MKVRGYYNVYTRNFWLAQGPSYRVFKSTHIMIEVHVRNLVERPFKGGGGVRHSALFLGTRLVEP